MSAANTAIPLLLGWLVESVNPETHRGVTREDLTRTAATYLAVIGCAYVVREALNVWRRFLVENACTRIDRDLCVRVVAHLMTVDLSALAHEQVGDVGRPPGSPTLCHKRITMSFGTPERMKTPSFARMVGIAGTGFSERISPSGGHHRVPDRVATSCPSGYRLSVWY